MVEFVTTVVVECVGVVPVVEVVVKVVLVAVVVVGVVLEVDGLSEVVVEFVVIV